MHPRTERTLVIQDGQVVGPGESLGHTGYAVLEGDLTVGVLGVRRNDTRKLSHLVLFVGALLKMMKSPTGDLALGLFEPVYDRGYRPDDIRL